MLTMTGLPACFTRRTSRYIVSDAIADPPACMQLSQVGGTLLACAVTQGLLAGSDLQGCKYTKALIQAHLQV